MKIIKSDKKSSIVELTQNQLEIITYHLDMFYNCDINEISKEYNKEIIKSETHDFLINAHKQNIFGYLPEKK